MSADRILDSWCPSRVLTIDPGEIKSSPSRGARLGPTAQPLLEVTRAASIPVNLVFPSSCLRVALAAEMRLKSDQFWLDAATVCGYLWVDSGPSLTTFGANFWPMFAILGR